MAEFSLLKMEQTSLKCSTRDIVSVRSGKESTGRNTGDDMGKQNLRDGGEFIYYKIKPKITKKTTN